MVRRLWLKAILVAASLALMVSPAWPAVQLVFKDKVEVGGPEITLADLVTQVHGAGPELAKRLKEIVVERSPLPGQTKTLSSSTVQGFLTYQRLGLDSFQAQVPPRIMVSRGVQRITAEAMAEHFRQAVRDSLPSVPDEVVFESLNVPRTFSLPAGELEVQAELAGQSRLPGQAVVNLSFTVDGRPAETKRVSGMVRFLMKAVVAARPLAQGSIVSKEDVTLAKLPTGPGADQVVTDPAKVVGLRLSRSLQTGEPFKTSQVDRPIMVRKGDVVTLVAQRGRLLVTASGQVRDASGAQGDQVKVLNLTTRREVYGQVVDSKTVKVTF